MNRKIINDNIFANEALPLQWRLSLWSVKSWWDRRFGTAEQRKNAILGDLVQRGIGAVNTTGWDLSADPEGIIAEALEWLSQKIALARTPYGSSAIILKIYPLAKDRETCCGDVIALPPFHKKQWPEFKSQVADVMRRSAESSPVKAAAVHLFDFGDTLLHAVNENRWKHRRKSEGI